MIERSGWNFELICDHCEHSTDGFDEFEEAVKDKKAHGWKSMKSDRGNWFEFCPKCSMPEIMEEYKGK
jgi:hypothetical protein